jgi:signal-transduction protein with cAMP-binding, CBS, and nucleotidyltransferase domain
MSRPPITAKDSDTAAAVALLMAKRDVGCIIIVNGSGKPEGIITEKDIVQRIASKNLVPSRVKASEVMSKPIIGIPPNTPVNEAAKRMNQEKIRRLAVVEGGKLTGILTMKDILEVTPAMMDLISEKSRLARVESPRSQSALAGYCDECEAWSEHLVQKEGVFVCSDCAKDIGASEES